MNGADSGGPCPYSVDEPSALPRGKICPPVRDIQILKRAPGEGL